MTLAVTALLVLVPQNFEKTSIHLHRRKLTFTFQGVCIFPSLWIEHLIKWEMVLDLFNMGYSLASIQKKSKSEVFCHSESMHSTIIRTTRNKIVTMSQFLSIMKLTVLVERF